MKITIYAPVCKAIPKKHRKRSNTEKQYKKLQMTIDSIKNVSCLAKETSYRPQS